MSSKSSSGSKNNSSPLLAALSRTNSVASTSLHRTIRQHVNTDEYDAKTDGLDFLQVKNGLMISYLIDLTMILRSRCRRRRQEEEGAQDVHHSEQSEQQLQQDRQYLQEEKECINRLLEMKTTLEKIRPLEKKMRYQIDKLLALSTLGAGTFAAGGMEEEEGMEVGGNMEGGKGEGDDAVGGDGNADLLESDPLSFKPDLKGMMNMFEEDDNEVSLLLSFTLLFIMQ